MFFPLSLPDALHEFEIHASLRILTIKINQWARVNFCSYRKKGVEHKQERRESLQSRSARTRMLNAGQSECGVDVRTGVLIAISNYKSRARL